MKVRLGSLPYGSRFCYYGARMTHVPRPAGSDPSLVCIGLEEDRLVGEVAFVDPNTMVGLVPEPVAFDRPPVVGWGGWHGPREWYVSGWLRGNNDMLLCPTYPETPEWWTGSKLSWHEAMSE